MKNESLEILETAISDVGYLQWWTSDFPDLVQVEFGGTQLYLDKGEKQMPPCSQIAIQFGNPKSVSFFTNKNYTEEKNWYELLNQDKIEPKPCSSDRFSFTDKELITQIFSEAVNINVIYGYPPTEQTFFTETFQFAFYAGGCGFAVSAEALKLITKNGEIGLKQIPQLYDAWWKYWEKYWSVRNTKHALPNDYACEVTIPLKE